VAALEQAEQAIAVNGNDPAGYLWPRASSGPRQPWVEARSALDITLRSDPRGWTARGALHHTAASYYFERDYAAAEVQPGG